MKTKLLLIILSVTTILLSGCQATTEKAEISNASSIINELLSNNYTYTISNYNISTDNSQNIVTTYDCKVISDGYRSNCCIS